MRELRLASADGVDVAAALHTPHRGTGSRAPVLLFPGARGDHAAPHLVAVAEVLAAAGHPVVRAALSPRPPGSGIPGPAERQLGRARSVLEAARDLVDAPTGNWILGGASYGGRVASLTVADATGRAIGVSGLILIAYPLHPPGRPERLRVAHFGDIDVPVVLLVGDCDPFFTADLWRASQPAFTVPVTALVVPGGRHDLAVSARSAPDGITRTPSEAVAIHADALVDWAAARHDG